MSDQRDDPEDELVTRALDDADAYFAGMYDYHGPWRLEVVELIGFGSSGGNDQQRIAGSWVFEFTVP